MKVKYRLLVWQRYNQISNPLKYLHIILIQNNSVEVITYTNSKYKSIFMNSSTLLQLKTQLPISSATKTIPQELLSLELLIASSAIFARE